MKKDFTLIFCCKAILAIVMALTFVQNANAGNLYACHVRLDSYPSGAGTVYLTNTYASESCDPNESVFFQFVTASKMVRLTATPNDGWNFLSYSKATWDADHTVYIHNENIITSSNPFETSVNTDLTSDDPFEVSNLIPSTPQDVYCALFTRVIASSTVWGSVSIDKKVNKDGDDITLTATPENSNCRFTCWKLEGDTVSVDSILKVHVNGPAEYQACFVNDSVINLNFPEEGGYYMYYNDSITLTSYNENQKSYAFTTDSVRARSENNDDNFITPVASSIIYPKKTPHLIYGSGPATFIKTGLDIQEPTITMLAWSGSDGVCVDTLATGFAYYSFDTENELFNILSAGDVVSANTVYLALPDSCYRDIDGAPKVFHIVPVPAIVDGISTVGTESAKGNGKIFNLNGVQLKGVSEDGIYIIDGKKVIFRKK